MTEPSDLVGAVSEHYRARAAVYDETAGYMDPEAEQRRVPIKVRYREMFVDHTPPSLEPPHVAPELSCFATCIWVY